MYVLQGTVQFGRSTTFTHNSAERDGGALYAVSTAIHLNKRIRYTFNSAENGGALYLKDESSLIVETHTHYNSSFNRAHGYGGGIYHDDNTAPSQCSYDDNAPYLEVPRCFMKFKSRSELFYRTGLISYFDSAERDGSFLYGGLLDRCHLNNELQITQKNISTVYQFLKYKDVILNIIGNSSKAQPISSKPYALCFCDGPQDCTGSRTKEVHRGQQFSVPLVAIAQWNSVISTHVIAVTSVAASLQLHQNPQFLHQYCSNLTYNLYSTESTEEIIFYPDGPCHDTGYARAVLKLTLRPCPDAFVLTSDGRCVCEERLRQYNVSCTIDEDVVLVKKAGAGFWMGAEYLNESYYNGLILYKTCPAEYCRTDETNMTLLDLDIQCAQFRTGLLCGGCADNYSLLIGSSKCKECSNTHLVLILPFAAAGVALVVFLSILRLTVATGMINSLILYANIIQANKKIFFPANTLSANILTVFIAWMNLDLGFETCFYDGMDAFSLTCLQFAFPVYVWVIIGFIILTSRYSITLSRLIGHNPIAVLATLLVISYTKILRIIIEVYSSVKLDYPHERFITVWLRDANVPYLQTKHLALTVVTSLVLVLFFLPYTLFLLLGHKLYRLSEKKHLRWLNRFKPLLDSYHAPYKIHTRYWTGFLLLVRCALYSVFSYNSLGGTDTSLLAIVIAFTAIGYSIGFVHRGRIYKDVSVNILEASIYFNLVTLSAVTSSRIAAKTLTAITYFLVGMVFAMMLVVIVYHFHVSSTAKLPMWLKLKATILSRCLNPRSTTETISAAVNAGKSSHDQHALVTRTVIDLREPLLEEGISK